MVYNGINSTIGYYRGKHDSANSMVAGALSGMLFKSTKGLRPMLISGSLVAGVAGAWAVSSLKYILTTAVCRLHMSDIVKRQITRKTLF